jgi:hypothetical protein
MAGISPVIGFALGALVSALIYGPVVRWLTSLIRNLVSAEGRRETRRRGTWKLLLIFVTLHPVPWLFILGVPFVMYQLVRSPLHLLWLWMIVGGAVGAVLMFLYQTALRRRTTT